MKEIKRRVWAAVRKIGCFDFETQRVPTEEIIQKFKPLGDEQEELRTLPYISQLGARPCVTLGKKAFTNCGE